MIDSTKSRPASPRSRSLPVSGRRHAPRTLYVKDRTENLGWDWTNPDTSYADGLACMLVAGLCTLPAYAADRKAMHARRRRDWLMGKES